MSRREWIFTWRELKMSRGELKMSRREWIFTWGELKMSRGGVENEQQGVENE